MVNKQYNVQNINKNKAKFNHIDAETLKKSITVIPNSNDANQSQNAFERNLAQQFYHSITDSLDGNFDNNKYIATDNDSMGDIVKNSNSITGATDADSQSQKHLSINDIGRFQYILQMDREMVRHTFWLDSCLVFSMVSIWFSAERKKIRLMMKKQKKTKHGEADFSITL